jgi:hypothetical protein
LSTAVTSPDGSAMMPRPVRGVRAWLPRSVPALPTSCPAFWLDRPRFCWFSRSSSAFVCAIVKMTNLPSCVNDGVVPRGVLNS